MYNMIINFARLNMTRRPSMSLMACSLGLFSSRTLLMARVDDTVPPYPFIWRTFRPWHGVPQWKSLSPMYNIIIKLPGRLYVLSRVFSLLSEFHCGPLVVFQFRNLLFWQCLLDNVFLLFFDIRKSTNYLKKYLDLNI